eukprot:TRINITY_DN63361_c0_g1_i1.p1 TRINITY_DN63361_c0_g1~~TRINITY_DN63361_c0_g1_i1.p1  ORF type:complete len:388 (-),score=42.68 TRINITY_DN63361_c0_g1_i1:289-1452(-)
MLSNLCSIVFTFFGPHLVRGSVLKLVPLVLLEIVSAGPRAQVLRDLAQTRRDLARNRAKVLQIIWPGRFQDNGVDFRFHPVDYHGELPKFTYVYPADDADQESLDYQEALEPLVSVSAVRHLKECCKSGFGHFLDIGGNYGWYALLMASLGCEVDTFEPVPWFASLIEFSKDVANPENVSSRIRVHKDVIIGRASGFEKTLVVPRRGQMGTAGVDGAFWTVGGKVGCGVTSDCINLTTVTVDELVPKFFSIDMVACGMKVDVEGFEPHVFKGARAYLHTLRPMVIAIELSPGMTQAGDRFHKRWLQTLEYLEALDYVPHLLHWHRIRAVYEWITRPGSWVENFRFHGDSRSLIQQCGYNCMVYFMKRTALTSTTTTQRTVTAATTND